MDFTVLYWHWIVFGITLMLAEIFLLSFTALWFGAAAVVVGVVVLALPQIPLAAQLLLWGGLSGVMAWAWFKYLKPLSIDKTKAGLSRESIVGEVGQVLKLPVGDQRGTLRFPAPILGNDEWAFICEDLIAAGDRVRVKEVSGNTLVVVKH